jgi:hypothetical protein
MNQLLERSVHELSSDATEEASERTNVAPASRWRFAFALALLTGLLILAHGCHGDEDRELFAALLGVLSEPRP